MSFVQIFSVTGFDLPSKVGPYHQSHMRGTHRSNLGNMRASGSRGYDEVFGSMACGFPALETKWTTKPNGARGSRLKV